MKQTSMFLFGLCMKLGIVFMIVCAIAAVVLQHMNPESLQAFNSVFQIVP